MKKVLVFGTFDIFHKGHRSFLKQARKYGDFLCVVIARDRTVQAVKKKNARNNELSRLAVVKESGMADKAILGNIMNKYAIIKKYKPDVICLGYDQEFFIDKLAKKLESFNLTKTKIIRLKSHKPEIYKSSKLMENKKGFMGLLVILAVVIVTAIAYGGYFFWQNAVVGNLKNTTEKAAKSAGVEVNTQNTSAQGQVDAVREMVGKIQDKKNAEIENELKK